MARPKEGYLLDGEPVPGSTTISGMLAKPALVGWAGKTMAEEARRYGKACLQAGMLGQEQPGFPRWTEVLYGQRDSAAEAGTCGHEASQAWLEGKDVDEAIAGFTEAAKSGGRLALESFKEWWARQGYTIYCMELPLVSRKHAYGVTHDIVVNGPAGYEVVELKTGGAYPEHLLQMAAQGQALRECMDIEVVRYNLVRITREQHPDVHTHSFTDLSDAWRAFLHCRKLYDLMAILKKRM